jgi:hypothetical protein
MPAIRTIGAVTFLIVGLFLCSGCASKESPAKTVRITPSSLFTGDLARLEPHLGWESGCFKVSYPAGPPVGLDVVVDKWQGGKRSFGGSMRVPEQPAPFTGEISVTVQPALNPDDGKPALRLVKSLVLTPGSGSFSGRSSSSCIVTRPPEKPLKTGVKETETLVRQIEKIVEASEGQEIALWGLMFQENKQPELLNHSRGESIEETAKRSDFAIVIKLRIKEERKPEQGTD